MLPAELRVNTKHFIYSLGVVPCRESRRLDVFLAFFRLGDLFPDLLSHGQELGCENEHLQHC